MTSTEQGEAVRARVERAALDLFTLRGFDAVTADEVADAAGISRRTFFRHHPTKADAVWGDFARHVARLDELLRGADDSAPVLATICSAYVDVNDYGPEDLPVLRQRMRLILTEPALQAHSQLRYAEIDRVVAEHVARRTGRSPTDLLPRLVGASTRAAAMTAFAVWLTDDHDPLRGHLTRAFDELTGGFPSLSG
ncbi:mycofactocin system transcriptional regulator [Blastococcus litoris]|uniref:mycofactocin system transcriptional regulator n=1 Tax=Blastococcus litoris TaxID=2171622 RepID=UPI000E306AE9|nr:mycofactocin system transcriptional regulator [Blastococcus litoris]